MLSGRWIILILFFISVVVRIPHLDRPLSKHHEFNAAMILIPMEVWDQTPASEHHYAPIMNYSNAGDKGVNNMTLEELQKNGNFYYLSFPSATYLLPYLSFKLFDISPSPLALQVFNMLVHLLCALLLYRIIRFLTMQNSVGTVETNQIDQLPAIVAAAVFLFSPTPLWFFGNGYTHHTLVILFILWTISISLRILHGNAHNRKWDWVQFFFALTLAILTAWSSYLLAFILFCIAIYRWFQTKKISVFLVIPILAVTLGSFLTYWQFSSVVGSDVFLTYLKDRFLVRSGTERGVGSGILHLLTSLGKWYAIGFLPVLVFLLYQVFSLKTFRFQFTKKERSFLIITICLCFSHHFLLGEFTAAHNYSVLLDGVLMSGLVGLLLRRMLDLKMRRRILYSSLGLVFLASITQYFYINRIGDYGQNGDRYDFMQRIGETIRANSTELEVLFVMNLKDKPAPQVMYYAKRNFHHVKSFNQADSLMKAHDIQLGKVFVIKDQAVDEIRTLSRELR